MKPQTITLSDKSYFRIMLLITIVIAYFTLQMLLSCYECVSVQDDSFSRFANVKGNMAKWIMEQCILGVVLFVASIIPRKPDV